MADTHDSLNKRIPCLFLFTKGEETSDAVQNGQKSLFYDLQRSNLPGTQWRFAYFETITLLFQLPRDQDTFLDIFIDQSLYCFFLLSAVSLLNQLWVDLCLLLSLPFLCDGRAQFPKKRLLTWSKWSILAARVSATIQSLVVKPVQMYTSITDASNIIESYIMTTTSVRKRCRHYTYSICAKFCLYIHSATAFNAS